MTAFPIDNLSPAQFALHIEAEQAKLDRLDAEIEFATVLAERMRAHGHATVADSIGCCFEADDFAEVDA